MKKINWKELLWGVVVATPALLSVYLIALALMFTNPTAGELGILCLFILFPIAVIFGDKLLD